MLKTKSLLLLAAVAALLAATLLTQREKTTTLPRAGEPLFAELTAKLNDVTEVEVESEARFDLRLESGRWIVPQLNGYVADSQKVRTWMLGLADLEIIEPKTKNPELHRKVGLSEPGAEGSTAARYTLRTADGETLVSLTTGTQTPSEVDPGLAELYVLDGDDPQVWLVEGRIPDYRGILDFVSNVLLELDRTRAERVVVHHSDGDVVAVARADEQAESFSIVGTETPVVPKAEWQVDDIGYGLTHLTLKGVALRDEAPFVEHFRVELETFDGLRVTLRASRPDEKTTLARLSARIDPAKVNDENRERLETEAATLNSRWEEWVFTMSSYEAGKYDYKLEDLVEVEAPVTDESSE